MRARATPSSKKNGNRPIGHDSKSPVPLFLDEHTPEQLEQYLDRVAMGVGLDLAARDIGSTGTRMRRYAAREPELKAMIDEALREGDAHYQERLRATARVLALDTNHPQPRILEVELATHVPGYEHLRRDRVKHEGRIEHGITIDLDPAKLDALPLDKLQALREVLADLGGEVIDGEATEVRELPAA